jgi:hypothetical protein
MNIALNCRKTFLPPPVTRSFEEPTAAGGWQNFGKTNGGKKQFLPPPMTPSGEEPIGMGGR